MSKQIVENFNNAVRSRTVLNQWRNSSAVIEWFKNLQNKEYLSFVQFEIVEFYPSITQNLLVEALEYANGFTDVTNDDRDVIMHARKSLLFDNNKAWCKKSNTSLFDVTMGSYEINNHNIGLYRDDGLGAFRNMGPRTADKLRKRFSKLFETFGLKITIQTNLKIVNYLDITLNLTR